MAKRLISTELFEDPFFVELSANAKLLYIYMFTKCDHAGIIEIAKRKAEFDTGIKDFDKCIEELGNRIATVPNKQNLYYLTKFFKFQYQNYPNTNFPPALRAVEKLKSLGIWDEDSSKVKASQPINSNKSTEKAPPEDETKINAAVELWNYFAENYNLSKILKLTDVRKSHIKQRLSEKEFNLEQILRKVERSEFLLGRKHNSEWKIDFDFIFSSKNNYIKILEGNYDGKNEQRTDTNRIKRIIEDTLNDPDFK